jgi:hypothetical protein
MSDEQPLALRLADAIDGCSVTESCAATELRRLHELHVLYRDKVQRLELENFSWRNKLGVRGYEEQFTDMLDEIQRLRAELKQAVIEDPIVGTKTWFNEEGKIVQQELKHSEVYEQPKDEPVVFNTLSSLRHKKTVGPIESAMTGRPQTTMQPCAGRNCGSMNPNLHSAECFEDYEKSTGMRKWVGLTDEEIKEIIGQWGDTPIKGYTRELFNKIEAKLKEKNG